MSVTNSDKKATNIENKHIHHNKTTKILHGILVNMLKHIFLVLRTYFDMFVDLVFGFLFEGERKKLPDLDKKHSILLESAVSLAEKIRNKELKSEDLVRACIERIQEVNPLLNAVTDERFEAALKDAREVDRLIEGGLTDDYFQKKPFLGVPFTAKESHAVSGMLHTLGVRSRAHIRAHEDAECVRLLREAGAIPVAVTNVPEINKWKETRNMVFGQTRNPHHAGRTTGGSSGGEAALQAAIAVPISLCSDIGGSTRMPAFYCGLYALNPTAGHTSLKGSALRSGLDPTMASIGFASRHCADLIPLTKIVAADKAKELNLDQAVDVKKLRYFFVETAQDLRVSPISADLRDAMTKVVTKLTEAAPSSDLAPRPFYHRGFNYMYSLWRHAMAKDTIILRHKVVTKLTEAAPSSDLAPRPFYHRGFNYMYSLWRHAMAKETESFAKLLTNNTGEAKFVVEAPKKLLGMSDYTLAAIMKLADEQILPAVNKEWAEKLTSELREELIKVLGDDGVLLFPSAPAPAPYHYVSLLRPFNFAYWGVFNALQFPAAQVPLKVNSDGLPLGIQVVAAPGHDALCVAVANFLGETVGGVQAPCYIPE